MVSQGQFRTVLVILVGPLRAENQPVALEKYHYITHALSTSTRYNSHIRVEGIAMAEVIDAKLRGSVANEVMPLTTTTT